MTKSRQPKGIPTGGQFAAETRHKPGINLTREEAEPQLELDEIERAQRFTGTYDADCTPGYCATMEKVFEAARATVLKSRAQLYAQDIWNEPRGTVTFIDAQMRAADGRPDRTELLRERRTLDARIGALDVNDAATRIRHELPAAATITASRFADEPEGEIHASLTDADRKISGPATRTTFPWTTSTSSGKYDAPTSPLRTCTADSGKRYVRSYDLNKVAALTPENIMEDQ